MQDNKRQLTPDTTLYPVPVVLITCGTDDDANIFSLNRIASCNAEPPMISISVRPLRASHTPIDQLGEFVVNIPGRIWNCSVTLLAQPPAALSTNGRKPD